MPLSQSSIAGSCGDVQQEVAERAQRVAAKQRVLVEHQLPVADRRRSRSRTSRARSASCARRAAGWSGPCGPATSRWSWPQQVVGRQRVAVVVAGAGPVELARRRAGERARRRPRRGPSARERSTSPGRGPKPARHSRRSACAWPNTPCTIGSPPPFGFGLGSSGPLGRIEYVGSQCFGCLRFACLRRASSAPTALVFASCSLHPPLLLGGVRRCWPRTVERTTAVERSQACPVTRHRLVRCSSGAATRTSRSKPRTQIEPVSRRGGRRTAAGCSTQRARERAQDVAVGDERRRRRRRAAPRR